MFNKLTITEKLAVVFSSCAFAVFAFWACLNITIAPSYTDLIVGNIAWSADTKIRDLIVLPIFITVIFVSFVSLSFLLFKQKQLFGDKCAAELSIQLIWWSLPTLVSVTSQILGRIFDPILVVISVAGIGFIIATTSYNLMKKTNVNVKVLSLYAFAILLISLVPLEIALVLGRVSISLAGRIDLTSFVNATYVFLIFGLVIGLFYAIRSPMKLSLILPKLLLAGQIGLCSLFLTLYPASLLQPDGTIIQYNTTIWLKILVFGFVFCGVSDVIYRYRKYLLTANWTKFFSPIALFALLVGLRLGNTVVPYISTDDYHFGENLLGWWSFLQGAIPYVDFVPSHGLVDNYATQMISFIFFDGTAGSFGEAGRLTFTILAFVAFVSMYLFSKNIGLAFISTLFLGGRLAWFFLTPFVCLWFSRSLQKHPSKWLAVWFLTAPLIVLGVPPKGLLLVASSGVMAAQFAWRFWRYPQERAWKFIGGSLAVIIVLGLTTPLVPMLIGAISYVLENAPLNQVAYGISWALSWDYGTQSRLVFELIRMSWVVIPIICLGIIFYGIKDFTQQKQIILPAVVALLFVLLLVPYSMGRIDPGGISRPGLVSIFAWVILMPIVAWSIIKPMNRVPFILLIACMGAALNLTSLSPSSFISAMSSQINTPPLRDGQGVGMPNIGKAFVHDEHWDRLTRLSSLLDTKLAPGETYIDLTSRNAQYFYFNRKPVIAITAPYNLVPLSQQKRTVRKLLQTMPRIALLAGDNIIHDGGGLALRTPYLYRFIVDNYIPAYEDGFIYGYNKTDLPPDYESTVNVSIKSFTDENWYNGFHRLESAFILDDPYIMSFIEEGDFVRFGNGKKRQVTRVWIEGNALWLEEPRIEPGILDPVNRIQLVLSTRRVAEYRVALFQRAFSQSDFHKIPVAWGRSEISLKNRMAPVRTLDGIKPISHHLTQEDGGYEVNDVDPFLSFDISDLHLSGKDAGLLRFDFTYVGEITEPRIQVFFWGDDHQGPFEAFSVRFTAGEGALIVPLDASSQWLTLKHIKGIRIDFDNVSIGNTVNIKNIGLFQRRF